MSAAANFSSRTAESNDRLRQTFWGGDLELSTKLQLLEERLIDRALQLVSEYDDFGPNCYLNSERDYGKFVLESYEIVWEINYGPNKVLRIMLACEF